MERPTPRSNDGRAARRPASAAIAALAALTAALLATAPLLHAGVETQGSITGTVITREDLLLSSVEGRGSQFDRVIFELGRKPVQASQPGVLPDGWKCAGDGGSWRCDGPPVERGYFSFQPTAKLDWPATTGLEVIGGGRSLFKSKLRVDPAAPAPIRDTFEGLVELPERLTIGQPFMITPLDYDFQPGTWRLKVGPGEWMGPHPTNRWYPGTDSAIGGDLWKRTPVDRRFFELPSTYVEGQPLRLRYDDPWGATLVDARWTDWRLDPAPSQPCEPVLVACHPKVVVGGTLCVCGCFPTPASFAGLELDGKPIGTFPVASSLTTLEIPMTDVAPGRHVLGWGAGPGRGTLEFEAVQIGGAIARDLLLVGQSTELAFTVAGTQSIVPMDIRLLKGSVSIHGGNVQTAYTSGGLDNRIDRMLHALGVGDFNVEFTIDLPPCPCGGSELIDDDGEWALHQFSPNGRGMGVFGQGLRLPIEFSSNTVIARTPRPPFELGQSIRLDFLQLGLHASSPGLPSMTFQQRTDAPSFGNLRDLRLDDEGTPIGGRIDLDLQSEFSMPFDKAAPFKVGAEYTVGFQELELEVGFDFGKPGHYQIAPGNGSRANATFSEIQQDKAGKTLFGRTRLELHSYTFDRVRF